MPSAVAFTGVPFSRNDIDSKVHVGVPGKGIEPASKVAADPTDKRPHRRSGPKILGSCVQRRQFPFEVVKAGVQCFQAPHRAGFQVCCGYVARCTAHGVA